MSTSRWIAGVIVVIVTLFGLIQLIPYGHNHTNPPVVREPDWSSQQVHTLVVRDCYDCHSNETSWPWYSNVAPVSWLIENDVQEGRRILNFSEWGAGEQETEELVEVVREGEMPPWYYFPLHPDAQLSSADQETLIEGLAALSGGEGRESKTGEGDEDDD
jgi:hypothetical protein